ncbi:hypothetical protein MHYP_G00358490 [Metynnis hypsauchen]
MFKAAQKNGQERGGRGRKKDAGAESLSPSYHHKSLEGGLTVPGHMGSGPLPVQPYPTDEVLRLSLSRGISLSLPSSPMMPPRQPYMLPLRPTTKSPGSVRKPKYVESPRVPAAAVSWTLRSEEHSEEQTYRYGNIQCHFALSSDQYFPLLFCKRSLDDSVLMSSNDLHSTVSSSRAF